MEVEIEKSERMTAGNEDKYVRLPKKLRENLRIKLYTFVILGTLCLQVFPAYIEDANADVAFVTTNTYQLITQKGNNKAELLPSDSIMLGCDPELMLLTEEEIIKSSIYFPKEGEVGNDGFVLELRPRPARSEYVIKDTLYELIKKARTMINDRMRYPEKTMMMATSFVPNKKGSCWNQKANCYLNTVPYYTAGFHLHFGIPQKLLHMQSYQYKKHIMEQIVRVLDFYVGVPSIIIEDPKESNRRTDITIGYGKPGDYRAGDVTLEYRVPGGANLKHPIFSCGLLGMGSLVIEDILHRLEYDTDNFSSPVKDLRAIYPNIPATEEIVGLFLAPSVDNAKRHIDTIYADLNNMFNDDRHKKSIEDYFNNLLVAETMSKDIEYNWRTYYNE